MFAFVDAYDRAYEQAANEVGLSIAHACVLGRLGEWRGMGELANQLGCDASNVTQIVARLQARSLVRRQADPHDGRACQIKRTAEGDTLSRRFEHAFTFAHQAASSLSESERDELAVLLRKALGEVPGRGGEATQGARSDGDRS